MDPTQQMKNDAVLRDEVMDEIRSNPFIASRDIAANAGSNLVRLTGFVAAYAEKYAAETKSYGSKPNSAKPMLRQCAKCRRLPEPESAIEIRQYRKSFTSVDAHRRTRCICSPHGTDTHPFQRRNTSAAGGR